MSKNFQFSNLKSDFIGKFSDFQLSSKFVKNNTLGPLSVRSFSKIQRETFEVEIFPIFSTSKNFFFFAELQELEHSAEGTFFRKIGNFSTFSTNSKIPKIYLSGPISVQSFSKKYFLKKSGIQAVGFSAKISNFLTWNRIYSENLPLFQLFRKFRNFIYFGLHVCQVSAKSKKLFFFIHHHHHHHHHHSSSSSSFRPLLKIEIGFSYF